jgi:hypothetical protein
MLFLALPLLLGAASPPPAPQKEADEYTLYELLSPESAQFHILYEVTATTPGATLFFNPIRKGSEASGEAVFDAASGGKLAFEQVGGSETVGLSDADPNGAYIRVHLSRPVPKEGGVRLLIEKTYRDPKSYYREGETIVFSRSLGIKRNAILLPQGYEVVSVNIPSQVLVQGDGRLRVSFLSASPAESPFVLKARRLP